MKCIHCGNDSKYPERPKQTCPKCHRKFVFEPRDGDPVTDMLFQNAIKSVSADGRLHWGVEHLYYEICRRKRGKVVPLGCCFFVLFVSVFLLTLASQQKAIRPPLVLLGVFSGLVCLILLLSRLRGPRVRMDLSTFNGLWQRWTAMHGMPTGVIKRVPEPELPKGLESDVGDYSFDRAVICDRARTVDLLLANNFHFENNCAILSIDGYPKKPFEIIRTMLKRNPKLQVFVLHDSTPLGCQVGHRLITDAQWFGASGLRLIDLGLRPRHAGPFRGCLLTADRDVKEGNGIDAAEAKWLSTYQLELAAVRPEQVLKRLFAGLQAHANDNPRTDDGVSSVSSCGAFDAGGYGGDGADGSGDGGSDGGGDAFG